MKLIIGLGNPGRKYLNTRHNLGFRVVERIKQSLNLNTKKQFKSEISPGEINGTEIMLIKPLTYMNNSGMAVQKVLEATGVPLEDLLVICDDFHLPFGKLRLKRGGTSGGHKGLESIIQHLGTNKFSRLRIGINSPLLEGHIKFVLEKFTSSEEKKLVCIIEEAIKAVVVWVNCGIEIAMNRFNQRRLKIEDL